MVGPRRREDGERRRHVRNHPTRRHAGVDDVHLLPARDRRDANPIIDVPHLGRPPPLPRAPGSAPHDGGANLLNDPVAVLASGPRPFLTAPKTSASILSATSRAYAFLEFRVGGVHVAGGINIAAGPVPQETIAPPRRRRIGRRNRGDRGRPRTSPPWGVLGSPATPRSREDFCDLRWSLPGD